MFKLIAALIVALLSFTVQAEQAQRIEAYRAAFYLGQEKMICGMIAQVHKGKSATYLNFDKPYPDQSISVVIWHDKLSSFTKKFGALKSLERKRVCALGKIEKYRDNLQVKVNKAQLLRKML